MAHVNKTTRKPAAHANQRQRPMGTMNTASRRLRKSTLQTPPVHSVRQPDCWQPAGLPAVLPCAITHSFRIRNKIGAAGAIAVPETPGASPVSIRFFSNARWRDASAGCDRHQPRPSFRFPMTDFRWPISDFRDAERHLPRIRHVRNSAHISQHSATE
jgi:hypothetical protein